MDVGSCAPCGDTQLGTTASITGILTFALGLFVSTFAFFILTRGAIGEIDTFHRDVGNSNEQLISCLEFCTSQIKYNEKNPELKGSQKLLENSLNSLLETLEVLSKDLKQLPKFDEKSRYPFYIQAWRRLMWVRRRQVFIDRMARMKWLKDEVLVGQMTLLLRWAWTTVLLRLWSCGLWWLFCRKSVLQDRQGKDGEDRGREIVWEGVLPAL